MILKLPLSCSRGWSSLAPSLTIETTRISTVVRASSARRKIKEDIPVAQRSRSARSNRASRGRGKGLFAATTLAVVVVAAATVPSFLVPRQPVIDLAIEGFRQRPDADGRLLGHFPYREANQDARITFQPGIELHVDAAEALDAMMIAAVSDGIDLRLLSGFRSLDLQEEIFFEVASERNQTPEERARVSAPPGYSEHSTGYAVDLGDGWAPETNLSQSFEQTAAFRWLQDHAARYHFVLSFPAGNSQGVLYEPWHWRFEGTADALRLFEAARRFAKQGS